MISIASATLAILVVSHIQGESPFLTKPRIRATVSGGDVFVSPGLGWNADSPATIGHGHFVFLGQELAANSRPSLHTLPDRVGNRSSDAILHRWQIDRKRVHFLCYDQMDGSVRGVLERHFDIVSSPLGLAKSLKTPAFSALEDVARKHLYQANGTWHAAGPPGWQMASSGWPVSQFFRQDVTFDFWPIADGQYEWYVSEPGLKDLSRLTRWDSSPLSEKGVKPKWTKVGSWTGNLVGDFYVTASGADRYFVSGSDGRIFLAPRGGKPGDPLKEVWTESPVALLLHDADAGKSYAFTKEQFFEITDPIKPKPHTVTFRFPISRQWDAHKALETAAKCGRVIRGLPEPK